MILKTVATQPPRDWLLARCSVRLRRRMLRSLRARSGTSLPLGNADRHGRDSVAHLLRLLTVPSNLQNRTPTWWNHHDDDVTADIRIKVCEKIR